MTLEYRIATATDLPQIADLRWRLRVDDTPVSDRRAHQRFITDFICVCEAEWQPNEIVHWIATDGERVVAVMSIAIVRKLPSPEAAGDIFPIPMFYPKCATPASGSGC